MHKWFILVLYVCFANSEGDIFTFDPDLAILAECVKNEIVKFDKQYTSVAEEAAYLAARRFHKRSMLDQVFNSRYSTLFNDLRTNRISHTISKDKLTQELRDALKKALMICRDKNSLSMDITENQKSGENTVLGNRWISFEPNRDWLYYCIEAHLKLTGHREFHLQNEFTKDIADFAARRYYGKSLSRQDFFKSSRNLFYTLLKNKIYHNIDVDKLSRELQLSVTRAVENCGMNKIYLAALPIFKKEFTETAQLLNLILVKWPNDLRYMIQSQDGRRVLRRFANDARKALLNVLNVFRNNSQVFRLVLRSFWKNRARELFDANSVELPYIEHRYTLNYPTPHMIFSNFHAFVKRKNKSFNDRNPLVPYSYLSRILNIHTTVRDNVNEVDIFDDYINNGMTISDYYLENQINQFYRIIFFFLELGARGISTDENDIYCKSLPFNLVPENIQAIVYDDDVYRDYLLDERQFYKMLMGNNNQNKIAQNLFQNVRVFEENLILLRSNIPSESLIKLEKSLGSVTASFTSTTTQSLKRKDDVWKNENGKCFPRKRVKPTTSPESNSSVYENLNTENLNGNSVLPIQEINNYDVVSSTREDFTVCSEFLTLQGEENIKINDVYGYTTFDLDQLQFSHEDYLFF